MSKQKSYNEMHDHYCAWQSSGLSQHIYSKQNGLQPAQLSYWVSKFRKAEAPIPVEESGFLPVVVTSDVSTPIFEIKHRSGHRISFYQLVDISFIKDLLV